MIDLKVRRESLGLSQEKVARKIHVTRSTVSKWEKGNIKNMKRDKIRGLAQVLKINPLLLGINPSEKDQESQYNYFDVGLSAEILSKDDLFQSIDTKQITLPDAIMGKFAGNPNVIISRINSEAMNRVIPNGSLIVIQKVDSLEALKDNDIVVYQDGESISIKQFYNKKKKHTIIFTPDSNNDSFHPLSYSYNNLSNIKIIGKIIFNMVSI
ncbi:helix-turn-helix domain-containing protein [Lactobacillus mellis]|nr:helix-turn-helix domain-containing protein [Bombilactobacillus mellis]